MKVVAFGDPIVDIVSDVPAELLTRLQAEPGGCSLVDENELGDLLEQEEVKQSARRSLGGSAANVSKSLAVLGRRDGLKVNFCGMVGQDTAAQMVAVAFAHYDVQPCLLDAQGATASCVCLVTPDGQRTMRTCLAAAAGFCDPDSVPAELIQGAGLVHCEGYCLYRPGLTEGLLAAGRAAGAATSLDLASLEIVRARWSAVDALLARDLVDVVFCNEQEAEAVCQEARLKPTQEGPGASPTSTEYAAAAVEYLAGRCRLAVVSMGSQGCLMHSKRGEQTSAPAPEGVAVVDTVGAGDAFTAGVLWALLAGRNLTDAARAGCALGGTAVATKGGELSREDLEGLLARLSTQTMRVHEDCTLQHC